MVWSLLDLWIYLQIGWRIPAIIADPLNILIPHLVPLETAPPRQLSTWFINNNLRPHW